MWSLTRVTEPSVEPLSRDEVKAQSRIDFDDEDDLLDGLIVASRATAEEYLSRSLITQTWELGLPCFPRADRILLPRGPVQSVDSIQYRDATGALHSLTEGTTNDYILDLNAEIAEVVLPFSQGWPPTVLSTARPVVIQFTAGYGDQPDCIPMPIRLAMKQLIASWYENREVYTVARTSQAVVTYPMAFESLLATYRLRYSGPFPRA